MPRLDRDTVRHALRVAQERGFAEVELSYGEDTFRATLTPKPRAARAEVPPEPVEIPLAEITAPVVGFFREAAEPLVVGQYVQPGMIVGNVVALGIRNDVESHVGGEVMEVLVEPGQAVEYGQVLAKVRTA